MTTNFLSIQIQSKKKKIRSASINLSNDDIQDDATAVDWSPEMGYPDAQSKSKATPRPAVGTFFSSILTFCNFLTDSYGRPGKSHGASFNFKCSGR